LVSLMNNKWSIPRLVCGSNLVIFLNVPQLCLDAMDCLR
jgi:hypothetical protein